MSSGNQALGLNALLHLRVRERLFRDSLILKLTQLFESAIVLHLGIQWRQLHSHFRSFLPKRFLTFIRYESLSFNYLWFSLV